MADSNIPVATGEELWINLVKNAGLKLRSYDKDIEEKLRFALGLKSRPSLRTLLERHSVPTERLLAEFFALARPFTQMYEDILRLMEEIGRSRGKRNLDIEFDFDEAKKKFKLDLDAFRKQVETFKEITRPVTLEEWSYDDAWGLRGALFDNNYVPDSVKDWIATYMAGQWPTEEIELPSSNDAELDSLLNRVWAFRKVVLDSAKSFGLMREDLKGSERRYLRKFALIDGKLAGDRADLRELLALVDSDHWFRMITVQSYATAYISRTDPPHRSKLKKDLGAFLAKIPHQITEVEDRSSDVLQFLRLPIWKQRYELYSVWVLTQMVNALGGPRKFDFMLDDKGVFHVPFAARRLATLKTVEPPVHICSEVRYPLIEPVGKGRKEGMQPDYSLSVDRKDIPTTSFALVECKQYLSEARHKFGDAITDYAKGQPDAEVMLANYGPASEGILKYVPAEYHVRTRIRGHMQPENPQSTRKFRDWIVETVGRNCVPVSLPIPAPSSATAVPESIEEIEEISDADFQKKVERFSSTFQSGLQEDLALVAGLLWKRLPKDLDFHVVLLRDGESVHLFYRNPGSRTDKPWAELAADVTTGEGPEVISVCKEAGEICQVFVHSYSGEIRLDESDATVLIATSGGERGTYGCRGLGEGTWWHVVDYDLANGRLRCIGKMYSDPPNDVLASD